MLTYQPTTDLAASAALTYNNMRSYYEKNGVNWDQTSVFDQIQDLQNWDILDGEQCIGAFRLAFDDGECYLRDFQVIAGHKNRGIGTQTLDTIKRMALETNCGLVKLRVLKISPAFRLYQRNGFEVSRDDERFYYMSCALC